MLTLVNRHLSELIYLDYIIISSPDYTVLFTTIAHSQHDQQSDPHNSDNLSENQVLRAKLHYAD